MPEARLQRARDSANPAYDNEVAQRYVLPAIRMFRRLAAKTQADSTGRTSRIATRMARFFPEAQVDLRSVDRVSDTERIE